MSRLFTAADIATQALRRVGAISAYEDAADQQRHQIALDHLDQLIAEIAETERLWWTVPVTQDVRLQQGKAEYDLDALLQTDLNFVYRVYLRDQNGRDHELELIRRRHFEDIDDKDRRGDPQRVYVEADQQPLMRVHPVPDKDDQAIRLFGQAAADDVTTNDGEIAHGFSAGWQRYLQYMLAADLATGPIARFEQNEIERFYGFAQQAFRRLEARSQRENTNRPPKTPYRDF